MQKEIKNILVTGASTGIGLATVKELTGAGFSVVATVRSEKDRYSLQQQSLKNLNVLLLDVTDATAVKSLPDQLGKLNIKKLHGLVNNAGVALAAPFAYQDFSEVRQMMEVNVLSLMHVTQVLLPLLKKSDAAAAGRIVNISSVAGQNAAPFLSVYAASKHAVEGFSQGLRREMFLYGIDVVVIGPGSIKTPIWQKGFEMIQDKYAHTDFAVPFGKFIKLALHESEQALPVEDVSRLVVKAFAASSPDYRYAPVPRKWRNWYLPKLMPERWVDKIIARMFY
jgi:short-subunit dehydrogenase